MTAMGAITVVVGVSRWPILRPSAVSQMPWQWMNGFPVPHTDDGAGAYDRHRSRRLEGLAVPGGVSGVGGSSRHYIAERLATAAPKHHVAADASGRGKAFAMASSTACPGSRSNRSGTGEPAVAYIRSAVADRMNDAPHGSPCPPVRMASTRWHDLARIGSRIARCPNARPRPVPGTRPCCD